ncbi:MAG: tyrosine-type recombinase/integrase [Beijerinckiaceae bacterium]
MPPVRLSKRLIDGLVPMTRQYIAYDSEIAGFGVRVNPTGRKSWIIEYRSGGRNAPKQRLTLGPATQLTPDQARKSARELLARVRLGDDPQAERRAERTAMTVGDLLDLYLADEIAPKCAPNTLLLYRIYVNTHVKPALGRLPLTKLTHTDIARLHREIGRTRKVSANRIVKFLSGAFAYAVRCGLAPDDFKPAKGITPFKEEGRERYLTSAELARLGAALDEAETSGLPWLVDTDGLNAKHAPKESSRREVFPPQVTGAVRLLLLTGCRLREILHLRWQDADLERGLLFLPTSKTGKKTVVLNGPAIEVLNNLPRLGLYVIAGATAGQPDEKPRSDLKRPWSRIIARADLPGLRIHDLRHSFASIGAGASMGLTIIGKLLGHSQVSTTQRYAHLDSDPLRRASESIGRKIETALRG